MEAQLELKNVVVNEEWETPALPPAAGGELLWWWWNRYASASWAGVSEGKFGGKQQ